MATSKTAGLHKIAHAEKKAKRIISEARQRKTKRLRQAKEEASKLVTNLTKSKELEFIEFEKSFKETSGDTIKKINEDTEEKLILMEKEFNERKDQVIEHLIKIVLMEIKPQLHRNLRIDS